ncbi:MAG TPA: VOC family protein [Candidatus Dormibacteraeota bacterium]
MLKRVHHIGVAVADLERAKELARSLGLRLVREHQAGDGGPSVAFFQCGEVEIELLEHSRPEDRAVWLGGDNLGRIEHIAIEVDGDLAATIDALAGLGIEGDPPRPGPFGLSVRTHPETTTGIVLQLLQRQG